MTNPLPGLHHVAYVCRDLDATHHFYADLLGLPLVHTEISQRGEGWLKHVFYDLGGGSALAFFALHGMGEPDELKEWDFVAVAYGQLRLILGTPRAPNQEFIEGDEWGLNRLEQNTQRALVEIAKLTKRQSAAATP